MKLLNAIGERIVQSLRQMERELEEGALITVDTNRTRIHVLPLQPKA